MNNSCYLSAVINTISVVAHCGIHPFTQTTAFNRGLSWWDVRHVKFTVCMFRVGCIKATLMQKRELQAHLFRQEEVMLMYFNKIVSLRLLHLLFHSSHQLCPLPGLPIIGIPDDHFNTPTLQHFTFPGFPVQVKIHKKNIQNSHCHQDFFISPHSLPFPFTPLTSPSHMNPPRE